MTLLDVIDLELWENQNLKKNCNWKLLNMMVPIFYLLIVCCCLSQEQPKHKILLFIKKISSAHFTRNTLWSNQNGTLQIASSLFSILHKVTSMKKNVDQILLLNVEK